VSRSAGRRFLLPEFAAPDRSDPDGAEAVKHRICLTDTKNPPEIDLRAPSPRQHGDI